MQILTVHKGLSKQWWHSRRHGKYTETALAHSMHLSDDNTKQHKTTRKTVIIPRSCFCATNMPPPQHPHLPRDSHNNNKQDNTSRYSICVTCLVQRRHSGSNTPDRRQQPCITGPCCAVQRGSHCCRMPCAAVCAQPSTVGSRPLCAVVHCSDNPHPGCSQHPTACHTCTPQQACPVPPDTSQCTDPGLVSLPTTRCRAQPAQHISDCIRRPRSPLLAILSSLPPHSQGRPASHNNQLRAC